jgi:hypothetical protein
VDVPDVALVADPGRRSADSAERHDERVGRNGPDEQDDNANERSGEIRPPAVTGWRVWRADAQSLCERGICERDLRLDPAEAALIVLAEHARTSLAAAGLRARACIR